jgi:hypothetical protein
MHRSRIELRWARAVACFYGLTCVAVSAGCGDGKIATYPVTGTVQVDGKPAEGVVVVFCPAEGSDEFRKQRPFGNTDAHGKFNLTTFTPQDGAPEGEYKVMINWPAARGAAGGGDPNRQAAQMDRLRYRYINPETSGLKASVSSEATEVPAFELRTQ